MTSDAPDAPHLQVWVVVAAAPRSLMDRAASHGLTVTPMMFVAASATGPQSLARRLAEDGIGISSSMTGTSKAVAEVLAKASRAYAGELVRWAQAHPERLLMRAGDGGTRYRSVPGPWLDLGPLSV